MNLRHPLGPRVPRSVFALLALAASCGGIVVVDPGGGSGGEGGTSSTSATTATTNVTSTTTSVTTVTSTGSGGGPPCATCGEYISGEDFYPLCSHSAVLYDELVSCVCLTTCATPCESACQGAEFDPACEDCLYSDCYYAIDDCFNDF